MTTRLKKKVTQTGKQAMIDRERNYLLRKKKWQSEKLTITDSKKKKWQMQKSEKKRMAKTKKDRVIRQKILTEKKRIVQKTRMTEKE